MLDLSGGLRSGVSDYGSKPQHFILAENVEFRPYRACRVRKGSQRSSSDTLTQRPHTLMEWVASSTTSNKYACCGDGMFLVHLFRISSGAFTPQNVPFTMQPNVWLVWDQLNGAIFAAENVGTTPPMFYRASNVADKWLSGIYPKPGNSLTLTPAATGGNMVGGATSEYTYRLRWLYVDGSSDASTPQTVVMGAGNNCVNITTIPINPANRTDYLGWVLERSGNYNVAGASAAGPFYYVAAGTANTYPDTFADADLGYRSDDLWFTGIPNGHLDGLIAMGDRLVGWAGSTLYVSQPIGHPAGAGILNFDARNAYDFGLDDGDRITTVWRQNDRLIVHKEHSTWAFEGNDPSNYSKVWLASVGAAGARSAAGMGGTGWFHGAAGLHRIVGNEIAPWGYIDVGDVIESITDPRMSEVVIRNHIGQRVLIAFSQNASYNDAVLVHDLRFRTWEVWTGWYPSDILIPRVPDFGDTEAILIADPRDFDDAPFTYDFRVWTAYWGNKDERNSAGGAGNRVRVRLRTPWIDDGIPDIEKALEWLQVYAGGSALTLNAIVETDPPSGAFTLQLEVPDTGVLWGTPVWGQFVWGKPSLDSSTERGILIGLKGRRYRITYLADVESSFFFRGHVMSQIIQPARRYSKT